MLQYRVVGKINSFYDIPWDKLVIVTGGINGNKSWFFRIKGAFKKDNDDFRFTDDFVTTRFDEGAPISMSILETYWVD